MLVLFQFLPALIACFSGLFFYNKSELNHLVAKVTTIFSLVISCVGLSYYMYNNAMPQEWLTFEMPLLGQIGASFSIAFDGLTIMLSLLTSIAFCVVAFAPIPDTVGKRVSTYFCFLHLCQFALYGVFASNDAFCFYIFWELTLIPIYFLSSFFGGKDSVKITFSFFVYTFLASIFLLVGIIYLYEFSESGSFSHVALINSNIKDSPYAIVIFWMMFIAFAVKTPIFPFHGWQAMLYRTAPTTLTIVLSSVVAKMGLFAIFYWLLPMFPFVIPKVSTIIIGISIFSVVYAAVIAMRQQNLKAFLAYASLSHLSLMMAGLFTESQVALQGVLFQFFAHGVVNIGLWYIIIHLEKNYGNTQKSIFSGLVYRNTLLSFFLLIFSIANIAFPMTANFVGEWMIFAGLLFSPKLGEIQTIVYVVIAGFSVVLGAVYTLTYLQSTLYGHNTKQQPIMLTKRDCVGLLLLVGIILFSGLYPQFWLDLLNKDIQVIMDNVHSKFY